MKLVITDIDEASRRVFNDSVRANSESYESQEACKKALVHRQEMESVRFKEIYEIDYYDMSNYNFVIESTNAAPAEIAEEILSKMESYQKGEFTKLMELNPSSIFVGTEAEKSGDIIVNELNGTWFIKSGVEKLSQAISEGRKFVSVKVDAAYSPSIQEKDIYEAFAKEHGINYAKYPTETLKEEKGFMNFSKM